MYEDSEFAIDPTNPNFKQTQAMQDILAQRSQITASRVRSVERVARQRLLSGGEDLVQEKKTNRKKSKKKKKKNRKKNNA